MPQVRDAREEVNALFNTPSKQQKALAYACTIVNLVPRTIVEDKPHLLPSTFTIPAAPQYGDFSVFHVEEAIQHIPDPFDDRSHKLVTPPHEMARSICEDWASAHICLDENAKPGLLWFHGRLTKEDIRRQFKAEIEDALVMQRNWFRNLINLADADWEKSHNRLAVSDLQRMAADCLGVKRDWVSIEQFETKNCPFCTFSIPPGAIKCPNCKEVVDKEAYAKLKKEMGDGI